jgi:hypothetical protein
MEKKVVRVLNELPAKEERDKDAMMKLRTMVLTNERQVNERIDKIVEENFTIPEVKDTSLKDDKTHISFRDYMTNNLNSLA